MRLGDPRPDDEREPGVLDPVQVARGQHPSIGHDDHPCHPVPFLEGTQDREQGSGLGGVAPGQVNPGREPGRVGERPDLGLGSTRCSLLIPTLRSPCGPASSPLVPECSVVQSYITNADRPPAAAENAVHAFVIRSR
jgi:hypothetical protein